MKKNKKNVELCRGQKKIVALCIAFIFLLGGTVYAAGDITAGTSENANATQQKKAVVTGKVLDSNGVPITGANILLNETKQRTITDLEGNFSSEIDANIKTVTLQVSFIGFLTQNIKTVPGKTVRIVMEEDSNLLDEVVVTGYGIFKKSAYAGSASTLKVESLEEVPAINFQTLLQGSAPGVQVNSASGQPGAATSITIRGLGSFNASTSPLYVIDGVPVMSGDISSTDAGTDIMSTINNSDIESITVIKDAAAASLYGSRAANGVILLTTKTGKKGKAMFNLKTDWGFSDYSTPFLQTMSGEERRETFKEAFYNQAVSLKGLSGDDAQKFVNDNIEASAPIPWNGWADWESALFRKQAPFQNYDLSASGGDDKISYFTSLGYTDEKGLTYQQDFSRISGRVNVKYKFNEKLELSANMLYSTISQNVNSEGGTYTSPIYSSRHKVSASDPIYNEDGSYNQKLLSNGVRNPKMASDMNYHRQTARRSFNTLSANYKIIDGLAFNTAFSLDNTYTEYKSWTDPRSSDGASSNGSISANIYRYDQIVWRNNLTYVKSFAKKHNLDVLAGYETHEYSRYSLSGSVSDFPTIEKQEISNGASITNLSGSTSGWRLLSYLSRANYNYDNKYFLGVSARMDGSSRLHKDSRWGTFWSVSGAWRISEELFAETWKPILSDLKLRASFGSNGTLPSDYYGYMDLVTFGASYMSKPAIVESQIGNKDLKWEKNYNLNVGVDFKLFNRINTTVEFYNRNTSDLLLDMPISLTTGFSSILTNIGRVQNKGVEFEIDADIVKTRNVLWNSSLNFNSNKNVVRNLGGQEEIKSGAYIRKIGKPYYSFYVIEFAGINPETGVPQFYVNGEDDDPKNKEITENYTKANYVVYKSAEPALTGGWSNLLKYKIFDLNFTFTYSLGGYSYDRAASKLETSGNNTLDNIQALYKDRWRQPGDITSIEKFMVGSEYDMSKITSSRRIHSTDHLRLKNIVLGVSIPKNLVKSVGLSNVRAYFSAVNLLTFAAYNRYDPELQRSGDFYFESPKLKTLTFGLDIKF